MNEAEPLTLPLPPRPGATRPSEPSGEPDLRTQGSEAPRDAVNELRATGSELGAPPTILGIRPPALVTALWARLSPGQQRFFRFGVVGASGVIVNFAFMALGLWVFGGLEASVRDLCASALGTVVSVGTNFLLNDAWTWGDRKKGVGRREAALRFGAFAVGQGVGVALQIGIATFFRATLEWNAFLAQAIGIGVGTIVNYVINNRLVFKDKA